MTGSQLGPGLPGTGLWDSNLPRVSIRKFNTQLLFSVIPALNKITTSTMPTPTLLNDTQRETRRSQRSREMTPP